MHLLKFSFTFAFTFEQNITLSLCKIPRYLVTFESSWKLTSQHSTLKVC